MSAESSLSLSEETLLPDRTRTGEEGWHVLHVRSRQEKVLTGMMAGRGVECYLPVRMETTYHGRRKVRVERPLFPGYLFLWGTVDEAYEADRTRKVANLIRVTDQDLLEWELSNIHLALRGGAALTPCPAMPEGTRVVVRAGPFKGIEGLVQRAVPRGRLVLQVAMLGSAMSLEIEESVLAPL